MKATFDFDPEAQEYGPATLAVRRILNEWATVDWFVSPAGGGREQTALQLFGDHNALAKAHQPELFRDQVTLRPEMLTWREFSTLCKRVRERSSTWDWKYAVLKQMTSRHSKALGWKLADQAALLVQGRYKPGDLFIRVGDSAVWAVSPKLELKAFVPHEHIEAAQWYLSYAQMDFIECIEWQLAEKSNDTDSNPFVPLVRCYGAGFYPFSLSATEVKLCAFSA